MVREHRNPCVDIDVEFVHEGKRDFLTQEEAITKLGWMQERR